MFDTAQDPNFTAALALHSHKRDTALGITWPSTRTRGLLWYFNYQAEREFKQQLKADLAAAFVAGQALEARVTIAGLVAEIEAGVTPERRQEIITILARLEKLAEVMNNG
jgi:tellurite resistance protein